MSAVESGIVGYMVDDGLNDEKLNMIALPFKNVDGSGIDINRDLVIEGHTCVNDWAEGTSDFIQIWNGISYDQFYFYDDEMKWCNRDNDIPFGDNDSTLVPSDKYANGLPVGSAMWYAANKNGVRETDLKITYAGAIEEAPSVGYTLNPAKLNMLSNPYPVAYDLNDTDSIVISHHSVVEDWAEGTSDFIQIWNGIAYDQFYFYSDEGKWCNRDNDIPFGDNDPTLVPSNKYANGLPANTPFWYSANPKTVREGNLTIEFMNPIKK